MKKTLSIYIFTYFLLTNLSFSQQNERKFNIHTIAFYNLENLFDTINDINKDDEKSPKKEKEAKGQSRPDDGPIRIPIGV